MFCSLLLTVIAQANKEKKGNISTVDAESKLFSNKIKLKASTFCHAFPFHIIFDREMSIIQCGTSILRAIPQIKNGNCKLSDLFNIVRPHINFDFNSICSQIMSIFVLSLKPGILDPKITDPIQKNIETLSSIDDKESCTRFKGQMIFIKENDLVLFQCSPSVTSIDDLIS